MTTPDSKKRRRRDSLALSRVGYEAVMVALAEKRISRETWASISYVSRATAGRLLRCEKVDRASFYALLQSLGLAVSDDFIVVETVTIQQSSLPSDEFFIHKERLGIFMTATFDPANKPQIDLVLEHLRKLLTNCEVTFSPENDSFSLAGTIPEQKQKHVEMTLARLDALLTSCEVTS